MAREFDSLQAFIDADDQPIFVLDAELRYTAFNRAHAAAMRALYGAEITLGGRLTDHQTVAADREAAQANLERALTGERVVAGAFSGKPGRQRFFEVAHVPLLDAAGAVAGVGVQASDVTERKQAEATARESEALYRSILDASPDAVTLVDLEGSVRTASRAASPMFGYEREEDVVGRSLTEFLVPEDRARAKAAIARLLHGDRRGPEEYRGLRADGSSFPVEARGELVRDADGQAVSLVFSIRDVTERKRSHDALELSEAKFATAFRTSPDAINLNRASDGLYLDVSDGFTEITGFTRDDVRGKSSTDLAIWAGPEGREQIVRALQADRIVRGLEMRFQRKDGSLGTGLMSARVIDVDGEPCILSTTRDITESKRMEAALRESEQRYRTVADNTYDWEWWTAPDGRYLYVSPSCERISGHSAHDFLAEPELLYAITHRDDVAKLRAHMEAGASHLPQGHHLEFRITTPSGEERWIEHLCHQVVDAHGAHLGHRGSHRDITERKQAEDEIRRLNAELEERVVSRTAELAAANSELESFAYSISHDLRAPLRAIDGFSQMVFEDAADKLDADDLEHLQRVRAGAQRMAVLIDELLSLSRAGRVDMLMEDVDLSALATEILAELREAQPERRVETIVAPGLRVRADAVLLRAILANLLSNAWKFTSGHETARIEVGAAGTNGGQAYFVRDDGAGFDSRNAKHLFGAFQRMHHTGQFEGDGIGLAIVQRLVTRHGGRVWAEAEVEKGAIFFFTLPGNGSFTDR